MQMQKIKRRDADTRNLDSNDYMHVLYVKRK